MAGTGGPSAANRPTEKLPGFFPLSHMLVSELGVNASLSTSLRKVKLDFEIFFYQVVFPLSHMLVSEFGVNASLSTSLSKVKLDFEIYLNVLPKNGKIFYHPKCFKNQTFSKNFGTPTN